MNTQEILEQAEGLIELVAWIAGDELDDAPYTIKVKGNKVFCSEGGSAPIESTRQEFLEFFQGAKWFVTLEVERKGK